MRALLTISVVVSSAYLCLLLTHHAAGPLSIVLKVASTGLLVVVAAAAHHRHKLLILALVFSVNGDLLLELRRIGSLGPEQVFLLGLVAFLIAHIFYIALFAKAKSATRITKLRQMAIVIALMVAAATMMTLWPGLAEMRIPVLAYSVVLTLMVLSAQYSSFAPKVAIGALLFFVSDTMLAINIFGYPFSGARTFVWISYYIAQLLITIGVTSSPKSAAVSA
jgi:uncharacterized membrane protein YhhN